MTPLTLIALKMALPSTTEVSGCPSELLICPAGLSDTHVHLQDGETDGTATFLCSFRWSGNHVKMRQPEWKEKQQKSSWKPTTGLQTFRNSACQQKVCVKKKDLWLWRCSFTVQLILLSAGWGKALCRLSLLKYQRPAYKHIEWVWSAPEERRCSVSSCGLVALSSLSRAKGGVRVGFKINF